MARSDSRLFITPSTHIDELVFEHLKQGSDSISVKAAKAISTHYLAEVVATIDPKLENPELRFAVIQSMHELEARLNLIKSLFPALVPATLPTQPVWMPAPGFNGQVQPSPRLDAMPGLAKPEDRQTRPEDTGSEEASSSQHLVDTSGTSWSEFSVVSEKRN